MKGRAGCLIWGVSIALLWGGGQGVYTSMMNRTPTVLSIAEYAKTRPKAHWLRLTECRLDLPGALYWEKSGAIQELYVPVRPPKDAGPIAVLLATQDQGLIQAFRELQTAKDDAAAVQTYLRHVDKLKQREKVQGLVRFGIDLKDKEWKKMAALEKSLAPDFVLLDEGKEPSLLKGFAMLVPGLLIGGWAGLRAART